MLDELLATDVLWQMSLAERAAVLYLLDSMPRRATAFEVGSCRGGFTRILARRFETVYSIDIDHSQIFDKQSMPNVQWVTGDSALLLPSFLDPDREPYLRTHPVNLVLIDADHSYEAVLRDIQSVLRYPPLDDVLLLMHDSWYAPVRLAIDHAPWAESPYVHLVEKDFVPGDLVDGPGGKHFVGGLALALLRPDERQGDIVIGQSQDFMYRSVRDALQFAQHP